MLGRILIPLLLVTAQALASTEPVRWEQVSQEEGVTLYRKRVPGSDLLTYRAEALVEASASKLLGVLRDTSRRQEWTKNVKEIHRVRELGPGRWIELLRTRGRWPMKDREFLYLSELTYESPSRTVTVRVHSVTDPEFPPARDAIRAEIHSGLYQFTPLGDGSKTRLVAEIHADPKGSIPRWMVNRAQKNAPKRVLANLVRQAAKPDVSADPLFETLTGTTNR